MSVELLSAAACAIAEALEPLTPEQRKKAVEVALMLCPPDAVEPAKPPRKRRSDAGKERAKGYTTDEYIRENVPERE